MKKLVLIVPVILIVVIGFFWLGPKLTQDIDKHARQFYQERTAGKHPRPINAAITTCQINGHDCWEVVQLLGQTKVIPTENYTYTYENSALQNWGLTVTKYDMYRDGGSTYHILNDEVFIYTNHKIGSPHDQMGAVTVRFKKDPQSNNPEFDGPMFEYTPQGHLVNN